MASAYPDGLDSFANPLATDALSSPAHAAQHADINDAVEAIEATLGLNPEGDYDTVAERMGEVDAAVDAAAASAVAADASAAAALVSQLDAAQSSSDAQLWATQLVDPVEGSDYSAKYNANLAAASAALAESLVDSFDDRYLGAKATPPTVDNDGNPLTVGALYFDTVYSAMKVWTGSEWVDAATSIYSWSGPVSIVDNSANTALRVTQTGSGDVLRVEDEANPDGTALVIDSDGVLTTSNDINVTGSSRFVGHGVVYQVTSETRPGSPSAGDIIFETDTVSFYGWNGTEWAPIGGGGGGGGATGGGDDQIFYENGQTVTTDYTLTTDFNAVTAGPISIDVAATVTIPASSTWTVV